MISVLTQERLLGAALGSIFTGVFVIEQRRSIYNTILNNEAQVVPQSQERKLYLILKERLMVRMWQSIMKEIQCLVNVYSTPCECGFHKFCLEPPLLKECNNLQTTKLIVISGFCFSNSSFPIWVTRLNGIAKSFVKATGIREPIFGKKSRLEFSHLWNKAVDQTFGHVIESFSSRGK